MKSVLVLLMLCAVLIQACSPTAPNPAIFDKALDEAFAYLETFPVEHTEAQRVVWEEGWGEIVRNLFVAYRGNPDIRACMEAIQDAAEVAECRAELEAYR